MSLALQSNAFPLEGLVFGLAAGPTCLGSCLPVVLPLLAYRRKSVRLAAAQLGQFLGGRLAGYLVFAALAWTLGLLLPGAFRARGWFFAAVHLGIAAMLAVEAFRQRSDCTTCPGCARPAPAVPAALGFLTGLNLCPPFVAAGARVAGSPSLAGSLMFFVLFFAGTTAWFIPLAAVGWLPRPQALLVVARYTLLLLAGYFACLGLAALGGVLLHG